MEDNVLFQVKDHVLETTSSMDLNAPEVFLLHVLLVTLCKEITVFHLLQLPVLQDIPTTATNVFNKDQLLALMDTD